MIRPYRKWQDIVRTDTNKLVLMDNNILACRYGVEQLAELAETDYRIDLNQGMDARLVTPEIADILAKIKWLKHIRFSCDSEAQIKHIKKVAELLSERGIRGSKLFIYCLITKDIESDLKRIYAMRDIPGIMLYAQAERNPKQGIMPEPWQLEMAQRYVFCGTWRKRDWEETIKNRKWLQKRGVIKNATANES